MKDHKMRSVAIVVADLAESMRLDRYVAAHCSEVSRSIFSYPETTITCNGKRAKKSLQVTNGDELLITYRSREPLPLTAEDLPLSVLYEDEQLLLIDKVEGMVVHPGAGNWSHTVVNALLGRYGMEFASRFADTERPGIVHRLDKETSGVLALAKDQESSEALSAQFKNRSVERVYIAAVKGTPHNPFGSITTSIKRHPTRRTEMSVCAPEEGRDARTDYQVVGRGNGWSLLRIELFTGRTHQIRVHLRSIGHPVLGDSIYGSAAEYPMMLHALLLGFDHPKTGNRHRVIATLPARFTQLLGRRSTLGV